MDKYLIKRKAPPKFKMNTKPTNLNLTMTNNIANAKPLKHQFVVIDQYIEESCIRPCENLKYDQNYAKCVRLLNKLGPPNKTPETWKNYFRERKTQLLNEEQVRRKSVDEKNRSTLGGNNENCEIPTESQTEANNITVIDEENQNPNDQHNCGGSTTDPKHVLLRLNIKMEMLEKEMSTFKTENEKQKIEIENLKELIKKSGPPLISSTPLQTPYIAPQNTMEYERLQLKSERKNLENERLRHEIERLKWAMERITGNEQIIGSMIVSDVQRTPIRNISGQRKNKIVLPPSPSSMDTSNIRCRSQSVDSQKTVVFQPSDDQIKLKNHNKLKVNVNRQRIIQHHFQLASKCRKLKNHLRAANEKTRRLQGIHNGVQDNRRDIEHVMENGNKDV